MSDEQIKFYIPEDETIPTHLRLKVGDIDVYYKPLDVLGWIAYEFGFFRFQTDEDESRKIVERVAKIMEGQSCDHGASWRVVTITTAHDTWGFKYIVRFRKRDAG